MVSQTEFLERLKEALANDLSAQVVQEHVNYYRDYIQNEIKQGRKEEAVVAELGDPWVIARGIADSPSGSEKGQTYEAKESGKGNQRQTSKGLFPPDTWWKKAILIICAVLILFVLARIIKIFLPVLVVIVILVLIVRLNGGKKG